MKASLESARRRRCAALRSTQCLTILCLSASGLAALIACGQTPRERPPYADQTCLDKCGPAAAVGGGVGATDSGVGATEGGDAGAASGVELDVREATDLERTAAVTAERPLVVYSWADLERPLSESRGGSPVFVNTRGQTDWLLIVALDGRGEPDPAWLPTLAWQQPSSDPVIVPLFSSAVWSGWAEGLALAPTSPDPSKAHVLLRVTNTAGRARSGVSAVVASGAVAYGAGGTASDVLLETDTSGVIVWFNAPVGDGTSLTLSADGDEWAVAVPTLPGSVSLVAAAR